MKLTPIFFLLLTIVLLGCGEDESSGQVIDNITTYRGPTPLYKRTFSYDLNGRISKMIGTNLESDVVGLRCVFTYSEDQTQMEVNDLQLHNFKFENEQLVQYAFQEQLTLEGLLFNDTVSFEFNSENLKTIRLEDVDYSVEMDDHGNIVRIDGWGVELMYDDKPNPFKGLPVELISLDGDTGTLRSTLHYSNIIKYFNRNNAVNLGNHYSYTNGLVKEISYVVPAGYRFAEKISYRNY